MRVFQMLMAVLLLQPVKENQLNNSLQSDSGVIRHARILFCHQSVGDNILQGVRELGGRGGIELPNIVRLQDSAASEGACLFDTHIGKNGDPGSKCADFLETATNLAGGGLDLALMKFCFVDFSKSTNVDSVFQLYRRTIANLRSQFPRLLIVHCTVPLTVRTPLWKRFAKWLVGREDGSDAENLARQEYNDILRKQYSSEPIFDIAACESTLPDGSRSSFTLNGRVVYALADQYTDDGGHLNQMGRKVVAEEFVRVTARALASSTRNSK